MDGCGWMTKKLDKTVRLTRWPQRTRYLILRQYSCTSHQCGQRLPSIHIWLKLQCHVLAMYSGAAIYRIHARLINCTALNVLWVAENILMWRVLACQPSVTEDCLISGHTTSALLLGTGHVMHMAVTWPESVNMWHVEMAVTYSAVALIYVVCVQGFRPGFPPNCPPNFIPRGLPRPPCVNPADFRFSF